MTINYTTSLALGQPVTGTESGTWGDDVNNAITSYLDIAVAGTLTLTGDGAVTLSQTQGTSSATNISSITAQYAVLKIVGPLTAIKVITAPSVSKTYIVNNTDSTYGVTVKASGQTGVTVAAGRVALVAYNGTDYVLASTTDITKLLGTLAIANGGTGQTTASAAFNALSPITTTGDLIIGNGAASATRLAIGTNNFVLTSNGTTASWAALPSGGTVTSVSWTGGIVSVANSTTTPAFTIAGTSGGVPYFSASNTWASSAALAANAIVLGGGAGVAPATTTTGTGVVTALGINVGSSGAFTTNNAANTFTATQTFSGSSSVFSVVLNDAAEVTTVSATAATGTINYDITTQSVLYYTTNASANWTVNFRASSGTSLNTALATGQSATVAFLVTQGATAYYNNVVQVDGTTSGVTTRWIGGAPTAGNASGIDSYRYLIIKTGSATFTVLASVTQFKA